MDDRDIHREVRVAPGSGERNDTTESLSVDVGLVLEGVRAEREGKATRLLVGRGRRARKTQRRETQAGIDQREECLVGVAGGEGPGTAFGTCVGRRAETRNDFEHEGHVLSGDCGSPGTPRRDGKAQRLGSSR